MHVSVQCSGFTFSRITMIVICYNNNWSENKVFVCVFGSNIDTFVHSILCPIRSHPHSNRVYSLIWFHFPIIIICPLNGGSTAAHGSQTTGRRTGGRADRQIARAQKKTNKNDLMYVRLCGVIERVRVCQDMEFVDMAEWEMCPCRRQTHIAQIMHERLASVFMVNAGVTRQVI